MAPHYRRAGRWIVRGALLFVALLAARHLPRPSYDDVLRTYHVSPSTYAAESRAVVDTLLGRVPIGSTPTQVTKALDALGFVQSADSLELRATFLIDSTAARTVNAHHPYRDPYLSLDRFVCDSPALRLTFYFDERWRLRSIVATAARQCAFDGL